jgi:uncharacterized protein (TIGR01777 family)
MSKAGVVETPLPMKIVIPGGGGQIGCLLARAFEARGHDVTILSRRAAAGRRVYTVVWDGKTLGDWAKTLDGADVVINLAGRSVNCRYTAANRREIVASRVDSARVIAQAIHQAARPPHVWLQAATATIYSHRYDAPNDELTGNIGGTEPDAPDTWRFSIDVATQWEKATQEISLAQTRIVVLRSAMVMSPDHGGVFDALLRLVRFRLGGRSGDGRQYVSWIHETDFINAVLWLIAHDEIAGAVNLSAPHPLPNSAFMAELRQAWGARIGLPSPAWLLEVGAVAIRTETELILKSRRVVPTRLLQSGFEFQFSEWRAAAEELCRRWRAGR